MGVELTSTKINACKPQKQPYRVFDGGGLYLEVRPNGSRLWRLKYRISGKEKLLALGKYPAVTLQKARKERDKAKELIADGRDPVTEKHAARAADIHKAANTFEDVAKRWMTAKTWAPSYRESIESAFKRNIFPRIGKVPVADINARLLLSALRPMESRGALELLSRTRRWCSEVLCYAIGEGLREDDPASYIRKVLKKNESKNYPHLEHKQLGDFLRKLYDYQGRPESRLAVTLLLHTSVRTGELRAAKWKEFDLDEKLWTIPVERMKARRKNPHPHSVPLSKQVIALLNELKQLTGYSEYLFPNHGKYPYASENMINVVIHRLGYKGALVGHGFRSIFSTIANESGKWRADIIEIALAHKDSNAIRAIYNRATHLQERARLMQWYSDSLDVAQKGGEIVTLKRKA
jgi:integrase